MDGRRVATAALCDLAPFQIAMEPRIRPVWRGARLAGPALTVSTPPCEHPSVRAAAESVRPGEVIVVDGGGALACALWGDRMSRLAIERGASGVVIDGAIRDLEEVEELRFPVFAAGIVPTPPRHDAEGTIGGAVSCGGLDVRPGDFVYGDADGVVVVPAEIHDELLARVRATSP